MAPKKASQKKKETITELPGGALQTRFSIAQPNPDPKSRTRKQKAPEEDKTATTHAVPPGVTHEQVMPGTTLMSENPDPEIPGTRTRTKSKRLLQIDPLEPITPARPTRKTGKSRLHPQVQPVTPIASSLLATVRNSQNQRAARVLFTPRTKQHTNKALAQRQPSPTPQSAQLPAHPTLSLPSTSHLSHTRHHGDSSESESESLGTALAALNVQPQSGRRSSSPDSDVGHQKKTSLKPRGGAKDVWTFFEKSLGRQVCTLCRQAHATDSTHHVSSFSCTTGITNLRKHLFTDHIDMWVSTCKDLKIPITAKSALPAIRKFQNDPADETTPLELERPEYSKTAFVDALVDFVVADDQSINVIESPQLKKIFLLLRSELRESDIPGRSTIRNYIEKNYEAHMKQLEEEMMKAVGKISFTTDSWTDPNQTPFMAVTAHWIEATGSHKKLQLRADLIGFHHLPGRHTGEHLAHCFLFVTDRLKITKKIGWITSDNASNNDSMMTSLHFLLGKRKIDFNATAQRIRCFPHIINLACKAALSAITNLFYVDETADDYEPEPETSSEDCIATIRSLINAIHKSNLKKQRFSEYVSKSFDQNYRLLRDVATRWSSTLLMINRVLKLKEAIDDITHDNDFKDLHKFRLSDEDWSTLVDYQEILSVPHAFQDILGAETTPTLCYSIPAFSAFIQRWTDLMEENPEWEAIILPGLAKLVTYEDELPNTPAYVVSMAIDPANKLTYFRHGDRENFDDARTMFLEALDPYATSTNTMQRQTHKPSQKTAADILGLNRTRMPSQQAISIELEVDQYLSNPNQGTGILEFWQEHQLQYPRIFLLAMDIIPIQASSVPCERVFSSGKETMTPRRGRISPHLMEILQIMKFSIRKERPLNFTEGLNWKDELKFFEYASQTEPLGDAEAYGRSLEDPHEDSDDLEDMVDDAEKDLEALEQQLMEGHLEAGNGSDEDIFRR